MRELVEMAGLLLLAVGMAVWAMREMR